MSSFPKRVKIEAGTWKLGRVKLNLRDRRSLKKQLVRTSASPARTASWACWKVVSVNRAGTPARSAIQRASSIAIPVGSPSRVLNSKGGYQVWLTKTISPFSRRYSRSAEESSKPADGRGARPGREKKSRKQKPR